MTLRVFRTAAEAGRAAAGIVARRLEVQPGAVIGLATGRTMLPVYTELVRLHAAGRLDFAQAHTFNLDEFIGVARQDLRGFMDRHLFKHINLPAGHIHFLDGRSADLEAECARFERELIVVGGLDLQILGLGSNGHIGFNEPGVRLHARTHRARLRLETRRANAAFFGGRLNAVPREALSMGMATILQARAIVLVATGAAKAWAVASMHAGHITTSVPASFLQLHADVEIVLDVAAAAQLKRSLGGPEEVPASGVDLFADGRAR